MSYKPLTVETIEVAGIRHSLRAMRLPKDKQPKATTMEQDLRLASSLIKHGPDHGKFSRGIIVYAEVRMQVGFMIEFETYRHGVECLSTSSSMHNELLAIDGPELAEEKQAGLPEKVYIRIGTFSYQALRSMYRARRNHRHPDWQIFCDWIETLPYFTELIMPDLGKVNPKPDARIIDLAKRLVASGPSMAHVSASECHEIADFIMSLTE